MLAALPILTGLQLVLAFLGHDIASVPTHPLHTKIPKVHKKLGIGVSA